MKALRVCGYIAVLLVLALTAGWRWGALPQHSVGLDSTPTMAQGQSGNPLKVVAMGDSYISGEGAVSFYSGTDVPGVNTCHRAPTAFPVLVAEQLEKTMPKEWGYTGVELTFVACSGAETVNVGSTFTDPDAVPERQFPEPGGEPLQISALREHADADVVLLGLGGNDARFKEVVLTCSGQVTGCQEMAEPWMNRLDAGALTDPYARDGETYVMQDLKDVYGEITDVSPRAEVYVTTYPNPISAPSCERWGLDQAEAQFLGDYFLPRLNSEIALAANLANVKVIDLFDVFNGYGLCASSPEEDGPALNGFKFQQTDSFVLSFSQIGSSMQGSMHPTEAGHALVAEAVLARVYSDLEARYLAQTPIQIGPDSDPGSGPADFPPGTGPPGTGPPGLPPTPPGTPDGSWTMRDNSCSIEGTYFAVISRSSNVRTIGDAVPSSQACYADFAQQFTTLDVSADGKFAVPAGGRIVDGVGGQRDIIYQRQDSQWVLLVETPPPGTPTSGLNPLTAWLGSYGLVWIILLAGVALAALVAIGLVIDHLVMYFWRRGRSSA